MSRFTFTGRLVQGDPCEAFAQTDRTTKQPKLNQDGTPRKSFFVAVAVAKNPAQRFVIPGAPDYESQKALIDGDARAAWPQYFGQRPQNLHYDANLAPDCTNPKFANKVIDGDGFDDKGVPYSQNEGWAGCWVIKCSSGFAPKVWEWGAGGWVETHHTGRKIKCGDYVTVSGGCTSNKSADSPGMYMNFDTVSFEEEGPLIVTKTSVDPNTALGTRGGAPNGGQQGGVGAGSSSGGHVHGDQQSGTASEYSGYRDPNAGGGAGAPPPPADAPPPPPSGPQMTAAATTSYEAYKQAGWTDDQLRAKGLMV